jgi:hypothetical protein
MKMANIEGHEFLIARVGDNKGNDQIELSQIISL